MYNFIVFRHISKQKGQGYDSTANKHSVQDFWYVLKQRGQGYDRMANNVICMGNFMV
jgi:hypothetical protein